MVFWITAVCLGLAVVALLGVALLRARAVGEHPAAYDLRVYQDQLREVERDLARGVVSNDDAERVRAEVGRRVLAADAQVQKAGRGAAQPRGATMMIGAFTAVAVLGGGLGLYQVLGQPGARDLPLSSRIERSNEKRADRESQAEYEAKLPPHVALEPDNAEFATLMTRLREAVVTNPDDLEGQTLLARNEAALGNFRAAYTAQANVVRLKGGSATARDHVAAADMMISAAQGYVSPEAEGALRAALNADRTNQVARYYTGLMMLQNDRPDVAFRLWDGLLKEGPGNAPWIGPIRARITEIAAAAGVNYQLPPPMMAGAPGPRPLSGPTAEDIANAENLSPEERDEMVRNMVGRLNARMAAEGGTPEDWSRLISSFGMLGETERAAAIWGEAQQKFAGSPAVLATIRQGAIRAGLEAGTAPGDLAGPTNEDIENAAAMSPKERQEMIRNMVAQLAERLDSDGGTAPEWARLISSQTMLGDTDAARDTVAAARAALAGDTAGLRMIEDAARNVGLGQ